LQHATSSADLVQERRVPRAAVHLIDPSYGGAVALRLAPQSTARRRSLTSIGPVTFSPAALRRRR
jgi:hypothetical protein